MGISNMSVTLKKLIVILMSLLLVLSFAACGKDDNNSGGNSTTKDPTQNFDDEWGENDNLTSSELEQLESLWNDGINSGSVEITPPDSSNVDTSSETTSSEEETSSEATSSNEEGTASEGELKGEAVGNIGAIF